MKKAKKPAQRPFKLKKGAQEWLKFLKRMDELGFEKIPDSETIKEIVDKKLVKPERATAENALQRKYKCVLPTGYTVKILTSMMGMVFSQRGSAWIHIIKTATDEKVLTREFYRDKLDGLMKRLSAYAHFTKNIADSKPYKMDLVKISETEYVWKYKNGKEKIPFKVSEYLYGLSPENKTYISKNESKRNSYLRRSADVVKHRQREIQKKWN